MGFQREIRFCLFKSVHRPVSLEYRNLNVGHKLNFETQPNAARKYLVHSEFDAIGSKIRSVKIFLMMERSLKTKMALVLNFRQFLKSTACIECSKDFSRIFMVTVKTEESLNTLSSVYAI